MTTLYTQTTLMAPPPVRGQLCPEVPRGASVVIDRETGEGSTTSVEGRQVTLPADFVAQLLKDKSDIDGRPARLSSDPPGPESPAGHASGNAGAKLAAYAKREAELLARLAEYEKHGTPEQVAQYQAEVEKNAQKGSKAKS